MFTIHFKATQLLELDQRDPWFRGIVDTYHTEEAAVAFLESTARIYREKNGEDGSWAEFKDGVLELTHRLDDGPAYYWIKPATAEEAQDLLDREMAAKEPSL